MAKQETLPEAMVFGSSRVMGIDADQIQSLTGLRAFNYGVYGAQPTTYLAQLRYVVHLGVKLKLVVLGVDEFTFGDRPQHFDMQFAGHLGLFHELPFPENVDTAVRLLKSLRPRTTWRSVVRLFGAGGPEKTEESTRSDNVSSLQMRVSQQAKQMFTYQSHDEFIRSVRMSRRKLDQFREFVSSAKALGAEVRVILLPVQPEFERLVMEAPLARVREELNRQLRSACRESGALYFDFRNVARYGGDANAFTDGTHQTAVNFRRLTNVLFGRAPEAFVTASRRKNAGDETHATAQ